MIQSTTDRKSDSRTQPDDCQVQALPAEEIKRKGKDATECRSNGRAEQGFLPFVIVLCSQIHAPINLPIRSFLGSGP